MQQGFTGDKTREGFHKYLQAFLSVLNSHHLTEDEIAFPYFREKLPDAPFDLLIKTHETVVKVMGEIVQAIKTGEDVGGLDTELKNLDRSLMRLSEIWYPHIKLETTEFIDKADALISVEEQLRLVKLFSEHGQKNAVPPFLTVPFLLYNLSVENRKVFSQDMPAELTEHLVPVVWLDQWVSMKPFLLA